MLVFEPVSMNEKLKRLEQNIRPGTVNDLPVASYMLTADRVVISSVLYGLGMMFWAILDGPKVFSKSRREFVDVDFKAELFEMKCVAFLGGVDAHDFLFSSPQDALEFWNENHLGCS